MEDFIVLKLETKRQAEELAKLYLSVGKLVLASSVFGIIDTELSMITKFVIVLARFDIRLMVF